MRQRALCLVLAGAALAGCAPDADADIASPAAPATAPPTFAAPTATFAPATATTQPVVTTAAPATTQPVVTTAAPATTTTAPPPTTESTEPGGTESAGQLAALDTLTVASESGADTYDRDLFGGGWIDTDGDGCDTRCEVLEVERLTLPGGLTGWLSVYDNYSTDDPSELDIDHMVPLAEAWRSGASAWDPARRIAFANDLDAPTSLIAVTAATNRSKSDNDPAQWQPPNLEGWCDYTAAWIATKQKWGLTADQGEVSALRNMITARSC